MKFDIFIKTLLTEETEEAGAEATELQSVVDRHIEDLDELYTIIENALSNQDVANQRTSKYLSVNYYGKQYKIVIE